MKKNIRQKGFTLLEVIISIAIFSVLMLASSALFLTLYRQQKDSMGMIQRTNIANRVIKTLSNELREAANGEGLSSPLVKTEDNTLTFYSDIDQDDATEKISYFLVGTDFKKTVTEPGTEPHYSASGVTSVICGDVRNGGSPIFTYYDKNYTASTAPLPTPAVFASISLVGINLTLSTPSIKNSYPIQIKTKIKIRNL